MYSNASERPGCLPAVSSGAMGGCVSAGGDNKDTVDIDTVANEDCIGYYIFII